MFNICSCHNNPATATHELWLLRDVPFGANKCASKDILVFAKLNLTAV